MEKLIREIPSGNYILKFEKADIKKTLRSVEYQIKKVYEFNIVNGKFKERKLFHQVYTQGQAEEFENTFKNGFCCVEVYFDRAKSTNVIISSRKWSVENEVR